VVPTTEVGFEWLPAFPLPKADLLSADAHLSNINPALES
jgi:hypothetical protein